MPSRSSALLFFLSSLPPSLPLPTPLNPRRLLIRQPLAPGGDRASLPSTLHQIPNGTPARLAGGGVITGGISERRLLSLFSGYHRCGNEPATTARPCLGMKALQPLIAWVPLSQCTLYHSRIRRRGPDRSCITVRAFSSTLYRSVCCVPTEAIPDMAEVHGNHYLL